MKRKLEIALLITVIALGAAAFLLTSRSGHQEDIAALVGEETTIRNVTKGTVHYQIKPSNSPKAPQRRELKAGALHRYRSQAPMDIMYERAGREITRHLYSGKPYSFRHDEHDLINIYEGSHGREDAVDLAPYLPTPMAVVEKMLELAKVDRSDVVYDIGCGDGRIVIMAAEKYGALGVGIDIDPRRIKQSRDGAKNANVEELVEFRLGDATKMDISEATVVTLYLLPESNKILRPQLEKQLKPGVYVVSHNYSIPGWEEKEVEAVSIKDEKGKDHTIFLYKR